MVALLSGSAGVRAQLPPLDEATGPVEDTVAEIEQTADETVQSLGRSGSATGTSAGSAADAITQLVGSEAAGSSSPDKPDASGGGRAGRGRSPARRPGAAGTAAGNARVTEHSAEESVASPSYIPLQVHLTNDADGDGFYRETETAPRPGADVPFQLRLENLGSSELDIGAIRNATPTAIGPSERTTCRDTTGTRLAPGQATSCRFTVHDLAPPEDERAVAVIEVEVVETANPNAGTITDTSVVRTEAVGVLGAVARRALGSLASTGARIAWLVAGCVGLAAPGIWMTRLGHRRWPRRGQGRSES
jgi:hypothetical protein